MNFIIPLQVFFILSSFLYQPAPDEPCKLNIPNVVSPNRDGIGNFTITAGRDYNAFEMWIFDRWGNKMFNEKTQGNHCLDSLNMCLNNFFSKKQLKEGTYFYILNAMGENAGGDVDTCSRKGNLSMLR
jgi:hypothetical protein